MKRARRWVRNLLIALPGAMLVIFAFNYIIDPYSITQYNLLKIPNKFARDDRIEKVNHLRTHPAFDTIMLGSSRVYSMNPLMVSRYLGGTTYNAGVGTARTEDHLGFLLLLERIGKFPKNVVLGLDFYSFNPQLETNSYFLRNKALNFLNQTPTDDDYFAKFLSVDALRASFKTLKNFLLHPDEKPRFDRYGAAHDASQTFEFYVKEPHSGKRFTPDQIEREVRFIKTATYPRLSQKRMRYLARIVDLCSKHHCKLYLFITPLYGGLIDAIEQDPQLHRRLAEFKGAIAEKSAYSDFVTKNALNDDPAFFTNPTHTSAKSGNTVLGRLFNDENLTLPARFGISIPKKRQVPSNPF